MCIFQVLYRLCYQAQKDYNLYSEELKGTKAQIASVSVWHLYTSRPRMSSPSLDVEASSSTGAFQDDLQLYATESRRGDQDEAATGLYESLSRRLRGAL